MPRGDLGRALLLPQAGVDDQHRARQDWDHPLQRRELPLGAGHLLGGRRIWGGAALHRDVAGPLQLLAQHEGVGGGAERCDGQGGLDRA